MTIESDYRSRAQTARRWQIRFRWISMIVFQIFLVTLVISMPSFQSFKLARDLDRTGGLWTSRTQFLTRDDLEDVLHGLEQSERSAQSKAEQRKIRDQIELVNSLLSIIQNRPSRVTGDAKDPHDVGAWSNVIPLASVVVASGALLISLLGWFSTTIWAWRTDRRATLAEIRAQEEHDWKKADREGSQVVDL